MKRKCMMATVVLTLMMALLEGCGGIPETDNGSEVLSSEKGTEEDGLKEAESKVDGTAEDTAEDDKTAADKTVGTEQSGQNDGTGGSADGVKKLDLNEGDMFIGGKVRSVSSDSFVISRTLVDDEGNIIAMPGEGGSEEELVTVRCKDSTIFERWTISGAGADIDRAEAAFSEIKADDGVEAQGYFEGEEVVAEKVIIEVYE